LGYLIGVPTPFTIKGEIMNDNYPPGVTGNEYEIAGGDEFEEHFDCENVIDYHMVDDRHIEKLLVTINYALNSLTQERSKWVENQMRSNLEEMSRIFGSIYLEETSLNNDCGFSGVVLKEAYKDEVWWECPNCEKRHEITIDPRGQYE